MGMSKYLLENGAQIDVCSKGDLSTVWYAAIQNKSKALKVLLENDAQVDLLFNRNGFSTSMSAKLDTLKWLMYYWAVALLNINLQDKDGWSALLLASRQGHKEVAWTVYSIDLFFSSATKVSLHYVIILLWSMLITSISAFL